jgi:hypothetical protein
MKKLIFLALCLAVIGCTQAVITPTVTPDPVNLRVYDSAWNIVSEAAVASRAITSTAAIEAQVREYNAAHTDDQWRVIYGTDEIPVSAAPDAIAYIVASADYSILHQEEVDRADLEARRDAWRLTAEAWSDARGNLVPAVLYVDNIPPAPTVTPAPDPYAIFALYIIDSHSVIVFEEHPSEADYPRRLSDFRLQVELQEAFHPENPYTLITGRLYP